MLIFLFYISQINFVTLTLIFSGNILIKLSSFYNGSVYNESPSINNYLLLSPFISYLLVNFSIIASCLLFFHILILSVIVLSRILELNNVNKITPIIIHKHLNTRSSVELVGTSPYPTVVTVCITNYHEFIYRYSLVSRV